MDFAPLSLSTSELCTQFTTILESTNNPVKCGHTVGLMMSDCTPVDPLPWLQMSLTIFMENLLLPSLKTRG